MTMNVNRGGQSEIRSQSQIMLKPITQLRFDYDTTTIRRHHDAFDYDGSDRNYDLRSIQLRYGYDEKLTCLFFARVESRRMEAGARDTS